MTDPGFATRPARHDEIPILEVIEHHAAQRVAELGFEQVRSWPVTDPAVHAAAIAAGRLFVVAAADDPPVGFALVEEDAGAAHLRELDVLPQYKGLGLGRRLLDHACRWARSGGYQQLTLTTFRDVPFNAPFYARYGFRIIDRPPPWLASLREAERAAGIEIAPRVAMVIDL